MTEPWRARDGDVCGPTLVNVLPQVSASSSAPDPEPPPLAGPVQAIRLPFPPPPPNPVHRRSPALALGLVCALMVATGAASLGIARAIATGFPAHFSANDPPIVPDASPPPGATSPNAVLSVPALLTVLNTSPATAGVTVDPAQAGLIVDTTWPVRETALGSDDLGTLAAFETGSALQGDTADLAASACNCPALPPRPIATQRLFVPKQSEYPSWFVSELTTNAIAGSPAAVSFMVFTRASLASHWMLALETEVSFARGAASEYATPASLSGGFDLPSPPHNELPADLGAYFEHWADDGTAPPSSPFASGAFTTALGQTQAAHDEGLAAEGLVHRVAYSADVAQDGDWTVAANNLNAQPGYGWALSCGTVRYEAVTTLAPGAAVMLQPADRSTWGATLAPGQYTRITQWGLHESCFLDDLDGIPYLVLGHNGGVVRSTGVLAGTSS